MRYRWFESISLQGGVSNEPGGSLGKLDLCDLRCPPGCIRRGVIPNATMLVQRREWDAGMDPDTAARIQPA
jgi:hypothetical protein